MVIIFKVSAIEGVPQENNLSLLVYQVVMKAVPLSCATAISLSCALIILLKPFLITSQFQLRILCFPSRFALDSDSTCSTLYRPNDLSNYVLPDATNNVILLVVTIKAAILISYLSFPLFERCDVSVAERWATADEICLK